MYMTSSREPRYKRSTRERTPSYEEDRELSENSSSEEDEESSDRCTDESDESLGSQDCDSFQKDSECSIGCGFFDHRGTFTALNQGENFKKHYVHNPRILKQDKVTQKNLLSPFPSFTIPPLYKEVSGPPGYRVTSSRPTRERPNEVKSSGRVPRQTPRKRDDHEERSPCGIHKNRERKTCEKARGGRKERPHHSRCDRSEHILACMQCDQGRESSVKILKAGPEAENYLRHHPTVAASGRKAKPAEEEASKCHEKRGGGRQKRKTAVGPSTSDGRGHAVPEKCKREKNVAAIGVGGGQVREKLVYVVEEKGKDITKLETDLFTLNEILTIKKDLVELSEFAKKLKRLKEMKKESENERKQLNLCHCKPAEELLKDVNRRIEALEARQEELERGSKCGQKEETETDSKNSNGKQTSSNSQSKMAVMPKPSAMTTVLSFPKMEMFVSRGDDLSNNSDIVNELMDIKSQLQKLEKRRMSKEISVDASSPGDDSKQQKKDDHAIAVFSSRTYILTEPFNRNKEKVKKNEEGKGNNFGSPLQEKSGKEETKENVANWLKGVSPKNVENDMSVYLAMKREPDLETRDDQKPDLKCENCSQVLKEKNCENQEPQKNRAPNSRQVDVDVIDVRKEMSVGNQLFKYKECIVTPSGKIFAWVTNSNGKPLADPPTKEHDRPPSRNSLTLKAVRRSDSSGSVPSAIVTKDHIRRMRGAAKNRHFPPKAAQSKSMQELSVNSSIWKTVKTARNITLRKLGRMPLSSKDKKHKEDKNQFVKLLEAHLLALTKTLGMGVPSSTSCTYSEFLASINLDTEETSQTFESTETQRKGDRKPFIMAYTATTETDDGEDSDELSCEDSKEDKKRTKKRMKEEKKRRKKKESECKKRAKRRRKEQKKCDSIEKKRMQKEKQLEMKRNKQLRKELLESLSSECCPRKCIDKCLSMRRSSPECCVVKKRHGSECCPRKCVEDCHAKKRSANECSNRYKSSEDCQIQKKCECCSRKPSECHVKKTPPNDCVSKATFSEESHGRKKPANEWNPEEYQGRKKPLEDSHSTQKPSEECYVKRKQVEEPCPRRNPSEENLRRKQPEDLPPRRKPPEDPPPRRKPPEDLPPRRKPTEECLVRKKPPEDLPPRRKPTEENLRRRQPEEELPPRRKPTEECLVRRKQAEPSPRKNYKDEELQVSTDNNSSSFLLRSEDSLELHRKNLEGKRSSSRRCTPVVDTCRLKNFVKNLGRFYPKANNVSLKEYCIDKQKCKRPQMEKEKEVSDDDSGWDYCYYGYRIDDEDAGEEDDERVGHSRASHEYPFSWNRHNDHGYHNGQQHRGRDAKTNHLNSCKCVRVYLQSQLRRGWSGLRPCRKFSGTESTTEATSSRTAKSSKSNKSDAVFPGMKSQTFQVGHATEHRKRKKDKHRHKHHKRHHRKHGHGKCTCRKCGNVHSRGHHEEENLICDEKPSKKEVLIQESPNERKNDDIFPLFSFLSSFCKPKPRQSKCSKFSLKKINEVRYLKTCPLNLKKSIKGKCRIFQEGKKKKKNKHCDDSGCECKPRLTNIEHRLSELESRKIKDHCLVKKKKKHHKKKRSDSECPTDSEGKKKHKKKRKKHAGCSCECAAPERHRENSHECKKKRKHKRKKKCSCGHHEAEDVCTERQSETAAYYQAICSQDDAQNNSTSKTSTVDKKESSADTNSKDPQGVHRLKEGLPSLHSFWKNLRKQKVPGGRNGVESFFRRMTRRKPEYSSEQELSIIDDCSRSSPMPKVRHVRDAKEEPCVSGRRSRKKLKPNKEEQRERKEAKRQSKRNAERHSHKSQPSRKRCKG